MTSFPTPCRALTGGLIGACTLTLIHETARRALPDAPRMDILGMRALDRTLEAVGQEKPDKAHLHRYTLAGDLIANTLFYSLVGAEKGQNAWIRGSLLGAGAGLGALLLPGPLKLGRRPSQKTTATKVMTVAWYLLGGLAAAAAISLVGKNAEE